MAKKQISCCQADEEDYINMEITSSSSSFFFDSKNSPPQTREFEFQMSQTSKERETTASPADELFYKGKLLPLHLPPRLQMVQKLLQKEETFQDDEEQHYSIHFSTLSTPLSTNTSTPLESCNISPSESCRVSCELNPDEHFFDWSNELHGFIGDNPKKYWAKKLKLIKKSSLGQKLRQSQAYLKSLFSKSASSDESCAKPSCNVEEKHVSKCKDCLDKYIKVVKKNPFAQSGKGTTYPPTLANVLNSIEKEKILEDGFINNSHRRSFSGAIKRHCGTKKSSSSSSSGGSSSASSSSLSISSNGFYELQFLKRSSSASSEIETSIEGAIAHCKQSQKPFNSSGLCSLSASRISVSGDQERPGFCSI